MKHYILSTSGSSLESATQGPKNKIKPSSAMKSVAIFLHTGALRRTENIVRKRETVCSYIDTYMYQCIRTCTVNNKQQTTNNCTHGELKQVPMTACWWIGEIWVRRTVVHQQNRSKIPKTARLEDTLTEGRKEDQGHTHTLEGVHCREHTKTKGHKEV